MRFDEWIPPPADLVRARRVVLCALGFVYLVAFATFVLQWRGLLGSHGLTPSDLSDVKLAAIGWSGLVLSLPVLAGVGNAPILLALWVLYSLIVDNGDTWYSFGWEMQLLETGFIAVFLAPLWNPRSKRAPTVIPFILLAWLLMRLMLGAGLIKLRGDPCWRDLTCLAYHYETQPVPNPLSRVLHHAPLWVHRAGTLFNHFIELVVPFGLLGPRRVRFVAAGLMALFQLTLILSGNLAFLNWLTLVACIACFDDRLWGRSESLPPTRPTWILHTALAIVFAILSLEPIDNLLSPRQRMNTSFNRFHLVNTYGAFGSIGKTRDEIVFEGANDPAGPWLPYEFHCKPGDPKRAPCVISPYHYRLDWLMWFAAMGRPQHYPWTIDLAHAMLSGDADVLGLLAHNPFPETPPCLIRAQLYRYTFTPLGSDAYWDRELLGAYLPTLDLGMMK